MTKAFSQPPEKDYSLYHRGIIKAENAIFLNHDSIGGLKAFKQVFEGYDFVFVDDCIEAFQLALFYKRDDYAMDFIKKALENGFELHLLDSLRLNVGYPARYVIIHKTFITKNHAALETYSKACYRKYLERIDVRLLNEVLKRHVKEQLFKNYHPELRLTMMEQEQAIKEQSKEYFKITDDNLRFMDTLAARKIFLGEKNLGIYTDKLAKSLGLPIGSIERYEASLLKFYGIPAGTYIPIVTESAYYEINPVYNMLFHNAHSYETMSGYKDEAIKKGYLHPREYASLAFNQHGARDSLYLDAVSDPKAGDIRRVNKLREDLILPYYEVDRSKQQFAAKNNLKLSFGFCNRTR